MGYQGCDKLQLMNGLLAEDDPRRVQLFQVRHRTVCVCGRVCVCVCVCV